MPAEVTRVDDCAFIGCTELTTVKLTENVTSVGDNAFAGCTGLTAAELPTSLTIENLSYQGADGEWVYPIRPALGKDVFAGCTALTAVELPAAPELTGEWMDADGEKKNAYHPGIPEGMFRGCTSLTTIELPENLEVIEKDAFEGCTSLSSVTLHEKVSNLGEGVFKGCTSLASIALPASVHDLGKEVFAGCTSLASIALPAGLTTIAVRAFENCTSLTTLGLPEKFVKLGYNAFNGCSKLTRFTVAPGNENVKAGADGMLYSTDGKTLLRCPPGREGDLTLPLSIEGAYGYAFGGCSKLTSIKFPYQTKWKSLPEGLFEGCSGLNYLELPDGVESMSNYLFRGCTGLTSVKLPETIATVAKNAFDGLSDEATIYSYDGPILFRITIKLPNYDESLSEDENEARGNAKFQHLWDNNAFEGRNIKVMCLDTDLWRYQVNYNGSNGQETKGLTNYNAKSVELIVPLIDWKPTPMTGSTVEPGTTMELPATVGGKEMSYTVTINGKPVPAEELAGGTFTFPAATDYNQRIVVEGFLPPSNNLQYNDKYGERQSAPIYYGTHFTYTVKGLLSPLPVVKEPGSVKAAHPAGTYDLQGRRVGAEHRGLVIEDGKLKLRK